MIYFITKASKTYTLITFLNSWGVSLKGSVKLLPIERLVRAKKINSGTYILTDFDLLNDTQKDILDEVYSVLNNDSAQYKLLNQPGKSINRTHLLQKLYEKKINNFRCFPATQIPDNVQFPVFVRKGTDHSGKISELLPDTKQLENYIQKCIAGNFKSGELLITEFVDTSDSKNIFRKYSAFYVNDTIIPRHIFFSKKWMIKGADLAEKDFIAEELSYIQNNPHQKQLQEIFLMAEINYGRIDYGMLNDKMVVWEINSNPMIASSSSLKKSKRKATHQIFVKQFTTCFQSVDQTANNSAVPNPLHNYTSFSKNEIQNEFPFNKPTYLLSNFYYHIKTVILFNFYTIRNNFTK